MPAEKKQYLFLAEPGLLPHWKQAKNIPGADSLASTAHYSWAMAQLNLWMPPPVHAITAGAGELVDDPPLSTAKQKQYLLLPMPVLLPRRKQTSVMLRTDWFDGPTRDS